MHGQTTRCGRSGFPDLRLFSIASPIYQYFLDNSQISFIGANDAMDRRK